MRKIVIGGIDVIKHSDVNSSLDVREFFLWTNS